MFRFWLFCCLSQGILFFLPQAVSSAPLRVVAAENFYGNIAEQLGGSSVTVTSLLSDPNVDPHEYESSVAGAKAVSVANLIIENSGGYDDWMDKLLNASPNPRRIVLKAFDLAPEHLTENEHVWYDPENIKVIAQRVTQSLKTLDPSGTAKYDANLVSFLTQIQKVANKIASLKTKISGTPIALTETIFLYQAGPLGLKVLTPFEFEKAVAEGEDPPAVPSVTAEDQIRQKLVRVLVVNAQTATPETDKLQALAKGAGIPVVAVTETLPQNQTFQSWMLRQLDSLESALSN